MNPWKARIFELWGNLIRLAIWTATMATVAMLSCFAVVFTYQFLRHAWGWCKRVMFSNPW